MTLTSLIESEFRETNDALQISLFFFAPRLDSVEAVGQHLMEILVPPCAAISYYFFLSIEFY